MDRFVPNAPPKPTPPETVLLYEHQSFPLPPEIKRERRDAFMRFIGVACISIGMAFIAANWLRDLWPLYLVAPVLVVAVAWLWATHGER